MSEFATPSAFLSMVVTSAALKSENCGKQKKRGSRRQREDSEDSKGFGDDDDDDSSAGELSDTDEEESESNSDESEEEDEEEDVDKKSPSPYDDAAVAASSSSAPCSTAIQMVLVQPKSLQECKIVYVDAVQVRYRWIINISQHGPSAWGRVPSRC